MPKDISNALNPILGHQLSSVTFVQDYIQLGFDGPILTAVTVPQVSIGDAKYESKSIGYRDSLCERIGQLVTQATATENEEILIKFNDGTNFLISLRPQDYRAPEAAMFSDGLGNNWVW